MNGYDRTARIAAGAPAAAAEDLAVGQAFYDVFGQLAVVEHEPVVVYGGGVVRVHCRGRRSLQMAVGTKVELA